MFRKSNAEWATREIAALDFLLGIPLEAEREIVRKGFLEAEQQEESLLLDNNHRNSHSRRPTTSTITTNTYNDNTNSITGQEMILAPHHHSHRDGGSEWWGTIIDSDRVLSDNISKKREKMLEQQRLMDVLEAPSSDQPFHDEHVLAELQLLQQHPVPEQEKEGLQPKIPTHSKHAFPNTTNITGVTARYTPTATSSNVKATAGGAGGGGGGASLVPGRRLDGTIAQIVQIPLEAGGTEVNTRYRTVARRAAVREWEKEMVKHKKHGSSILDGRMFLSSMSSYPVATFSIIKYDPKNEEELRQRQKIEALGGGGSKFLLPRRDWRGVSYRDLLPRKERKNKTFYRMMKKRLERAKRRYQERQERQDHLYPQDDEHRGISSSNHDERNPNMHNKSFDYFDNENDEGNVSNISECSHSSDDDSSISSSSSEDSIVYEPGFLDDPNMKQGKHRHVMIGDRVTGPVMISSVHFVSPADLKNDLNRQFRQRFEDWEPPKSQRKYIGARVIDGQYTLIDPTNQEEENGDSAVDDGRRRRKYSVAEYDTIRMPPSLTLSKIRSLKKEALDVCVKANLEVSTVALACIYFERLCLDCRVDKSNRRLTFATCLLLALKVNESNVKIVHEESKESKKGKWNFAKSTIRPNIEHDFFENLFFFITHEWQLSLKELFHAEFGVFAALGFKLSASPSEISFHFKRLLRSMERSPVEYLGKEMYGYWQEAQESHSVRQLEREERKAKRKRKKEKEILRRQRELHQKDNIARQRSSSSLGEPEETDNTNAHEILSDDTPHLDTSVSQSKTGRRLQFFNRLKRASHITDRPPVDDNQTDHVRSGIEKVSPVGISRSISMPDVSNMEKVEAIGPLLELGLRSSSGNISSPDLQSSQSSPPPG